MHTDPSTHLTPPPPSHGFSFGFYGYRKPQLNGGGPGDVGLNVQDIGALHGGGRGGRENSIGMPLIQSYMVGQRGMWVYTYSDYVV